MKKFAVLAALLFLIVSCAQARQEDLYANWHLRQAECKKAGISPKTILAVQECINKAYADEARKAGFRDLGLLAASDKRAALDYAKGKIDKDEYEARTQENEAQAHLLETQMLSQQQANMAAAMGQGMQRMGNSYNAAAQNAPTASPFITCRQYLQTTTCY